MTDVPEPTAIEVDLDLDAPAGDTPPKVVHRRFRLRGQVFRVPHANIEAFSESVAVLDRKEAAEQATLKDIWAAQAEHIEASIHPDELAAYHAIRNRPVDSLSPSDLRRLYSYMWEAQTGRPTKSVEASTPGPESNAPSSKAESGSRVARPAS